VRYRFEVTGTVPTSLDVVVAGEQARIELGGTARASVIFRCTTETFVFVMYGRLTLQDALAHGRLTVDGEAELVTAFAQWFRGV
jgi:SCP-2 sterol transfer family